VNVFEQSMLLALVSVLAGFLGALTGLGGGAVIVPVLTLAFRVDMRYAIGASLVSVIATSSGAAAAFVREGFTNLRIGMLLEIGTTLGALAGAAIAAVAPTQALAIVFGVVLLHSAYLNTRPQQDRTDYAGSPDRLAAKLRLDGTYPAADGSIRAYHVRRVPLGFLLMGIAGVLSGLLGIGSGAIKVLAMDRAMRLPFKVSATTSNFMIGVTAAASAGVYLRRGYVDPGLAMPVVLGVLAGSMVGARVLRSTQSRVLRHVFAVVLVLLGLQMIYSALQGGM
jgi:uncharacterized membrane protein YfcA